jgi:hypothetical protein
MIDTTQIDRLVRAAEAYRRGDLTRREFRAIVLAVLGRIGDGNIVLEILLPNEVAEVIKNARDLVSGETLISLGSIPHAEAKTEDAGARIFNILVQRKTEIFTGLDFALAAKNVLADANGDWFKDPWELPEVTWLAERGHHVLAAMVMTKDPSVYASPADVPKSEQATRPAMILDPLGRLIYQAIIDADSAQLTGGLSRSTYGWRVPAGSETPGHYAENKFQWTEYLERIGEDADLNPNVLRSDIENFFSSIDTDSAIPTLVSDQSRAHYLARLVNTWNEQTGRRGLPQRCLASSVLANGFLAKVDDVVTQEWHPSPETISGHFSAVRWMDDFWIFSPSHFSRSSIEAPFRDAIENLGLTLNQDKTLWLDEYELFNAIDALDFSYELYALKDESDPQPLTERAQNMLLQGSSLTRTEVSFLARTARNHHLHEILDVLVEHPERLLAGIDQVCRAFREMGRAAELQDWFITTLRSSASAWVRSSLFHLLPKQSALNDKVRTVIQEVAEQDQEYMVISSALNYLSEHDSNSVIEIVRKRVSSTSDPALCRSMALAAARARMGRSEIIRMLDSFPQCFATLEMLRDMDFRLGPS